MAIHAESMYRVFYPANEAKSILSDGVKVVEQYPAFGIVQATPEAIEELRRHYPVEEISLPKPIPVAPEIANLSESISVPAKRGPYNMVIRFQLPPREGWEQEIEAIGCQALEPLGKLTVVVSCPNKPTLKQLLALTNVARVSTYIPNIRLDAQALHLLGLEQEQTGGENETEAIDFTTIAPPTPQRSISNIPVPGQFIASFFTAELAQRALRTLKRNGIRAIIAAGETGLIISLLDSEDLARDLQQIANTYGLRSLEHKYFKRLFNEVAREIIADGVAVGTGSGLSLTGKGEIVAVADTGLDTGDIATMHEDLRGRVKHIESFPIAASWGLGRTARTPLPPVPPPMLNAGTNDGPADDVSGHGTHVCGSILGNGQVAGQLGIGIGGPGVAPEAELVFQSIEQYAQWTREYARYLEHFDRTGSLPVLGLFGIPDNLEQLFQPAFDHGARLYSISWGGGTPGEYDIQCDQLDRFVWHHKDFLVLCSAGNDGRDLDGDSLIDLGSVTSLGTAKNCLTVGASESERKRITSTYGGRWPDPYKSDPMSDNPDDIATFSSRGPCADDRTKPDVVAPGTNILSIRSSTMFEPIPGPGDTLQILDFKDNYHLLNGTSMATPLVAGSAALVRQYLRENKGIANPSAALTKATLIHSAQYLPYRYARPDSKPWADNEQGWGRVSLGDVLRPSPPTKAIFVDSQEISSVGKDSTAVVRVADASVPLRITMVYTDYPGEQLINNLNLFAWAPNGNYFIGNDFQNSGALDKVNNVEGIVITNPELGEWKIQVVFSNVVKVAGGPHPQDFALVISAGGLQEM